MTNTINFTCQDFAALREKQFLPKARITEFSLRRNEEECDLALTIRLKGKDGTAGLRFEKVRQLMLNEPQIADGVMMIEGFAISDLRNAQLEGISWEISDYEDNSLHFYCAQIVAEA